MTSCRPTPEILTQPDDFLDVADRLSPGHCRSLYFSGARERLMDRAIISGRPVVMSRRRGGAWRHARAVVARWFDRVNGSARLAHDIAPADMALMRRIADA